MAQLVAGTRWSLEKRLNKLFGGWSESDGLTKRFAVTGSRKYGFPKHDSDIDVICTGVDPLRLLRRGFEYVSGLKLDGECLGEEEAARYPDSIGIIRMKRGRIDLLWCTKDAFLERLEARDRCIARGRISRQAAVLIHKEVEVEFEDRREAEAKRLAEEQQALVDRIVKHNQFIHLSSQVCLFNQGEVT